MESKRLNLGLVMGLHAESFGEPGQRTFRLLVETRAGRVSLWLEKQQIVALLAAADELLDRITEGDERGATSASADSLAGDLEVRVGSLSVGFDRSNDAFLLEAGDFETAFDLTHIAMLVNRGQLEAMRDELRDIVSHSRPRCPLCGTPLTGEPHFCPQSNGHADLSIED